VSKDGGPAFPSIQLDDRGEAIVPAQQGMTLRDYFASAALSGMLAAKTKAIRGGPNDELLLDNPDIVGPLAYRHADAMLAARAEGGAK
jgi:hypothetical protein